MAGTWIYDESVQVGTDYGDERIALAYDEDMGRLRDIAQEVDAAATALCVNEKATVWEIGTGTGEMALGLAARCAKVWAIDVSPAVLALARRKAIARGYGNVEFGIGGFLEGFAPSQRVNAVISQLTLHHLPDFWKLVALRRLARFLLPAGRLYLRDVVYPGDLEDYDAFFSQVVDEVRNKAGERMAQETSEHIRKEFSTFDWVLEELLRRAGFRIVEKEVQGFLVTYVCTR